MPDFSALILIKGLVIGFVIAAPVGPVGFLCIERTLGKSKLSGLVSGFGAAIADAVYGAIAAFGLIHISNFLIDHQSIFRVVGGVFLLYLGVYYLNKKSKEVGETPIRNYHLIGDFISALLLTITNPLTVISFATLFASTSFGHGIHGYSNVGQATTLTIGVFLGSVLCWSILVFGVAWLDARVDHFPVTLVNRIAGIAMLLFGAVMFLTL